MRIKAIETEYNGYLFRSRLEARWAVFFDEIGLTWEYEREGFDLDGVWYLPDFWIWEWNSFIEIKGDPSELESGIEKCEMLSKGIKPMVFLIYGPPDHKIHQVIFPRIDPSDNTTGAGIENPHNILQCRRCDGHWYGHVAGLAWGPFGNCKPGCNGEKFPWLSDELEKAFNKAKSYRF